MITFTEEQIKEAYKKSDNTIKTIVDDSWVIDDMVLIGKRFSLRVDKTDSIIRIITYIILNLIPISKMVDNIMAETGIEKEKSIEIAKKIDEVIFTKVKAMLRDSKHKEKSPNTNNPSLIRNTEIHSEKFSTQGDEEQNLPKILEERNPSQVSKKSVDPYRELFD